MPPAPSRTSRERGLHRLPQRDRLHEIDAPRSPSVHTVADPVAQSQFSHYSVAGMAVHAHAGFIAFTRLGDPAPPYGTMALTGALAYAIHTLAERLPAPVPKRALTPGGNGVAIPHG
ncbi:hypothetical protein [Nonomuraea sp. NPDC003201]